MTEPIRVEPGLYRNPLGAEIRVLCELNRNFRKHDPLFKRGIVPAVLGAIWIAEDVAAYGLGRLLVTAEGLASCGYRAVGTSTPISTVERHKLRVEAARGRTAERELERESAEASE